MAWWISMLLGIVQGATEFLPISSSGHLAIFQKLLSGYIEPEALQRILQFDILLHIGTLAAVFVAYWKDIEELIRAFVSLFSENGRSDRNGMPARRLLLLLIIATLPLLVSVFFKDQVEVLINNLIFVGCALIGTGTLLYIADKIKPGKKNEKTTRVSDAVTIGVMQAIAVIPGLSRSGSTISAGMMRGLDRQFAIKLSFLMSIPAVLGATLLELIHGLGAEGVKASDYFVYIPGMLTSAVVGYFSIIFLKRLAARGKFGAFVYYCLGAGLLAIILNFAL